MISAFHRFHGYSSLRFVYNRGKTVRGPLFLVKSAVNKRRSSYRLAIVVSRKVNKSAVVRNRIRRRLYEFVRELEPQINGPHDIVINVFHDAVAQTPTKELAGQLHKQLSEAGVLGGDQPT